MLHGYYIHLKDPTFDSEENDQKSIVNEGEDDEQALEPLPKGW